MTAQIPTNGLVAYYLFNSNANDGTVNANNGTVYGATLTTNRFGVANSAYKFNGTNHLYYRYTLYGSGSRRKQYPTVVHPTICMAPYQPQPAWSSALGITRQYTGKFLTNVFLALLNIVQFHKFIYNSING